MVDDDPDTVESFACLLGLMGHDVKQTTQPLEALPLAQSFRPHIAFLDIGMPHMDGYKLAGALRALPELTDLRLVALTAHGDPQHHVLSRKAGFDAHVQKPVDSGLLESILAQFLVA